MKMLAFTLLVLAAAYAQSIPDARTSTAARVSNFKPQRFAQLVSDPAPAPAPAPAPKKKRAKKTVEKEEEDKTPGISVAFKAIIIMVSLHFFATFIDLALSSRERTLRLFNEDPDTHATKGAADAIAKHFFLDQLKDAQKGMEEAVTEVAMASIIIIFAHYRIVLDCGYIGEKGKAEYPSDIEMAYWLIAGVIVVEFSFVFIAMLLNIAGDQAHASMRKCSSVCMDFVLFAGEFCTIGAIIFLLYKVLTEERREGWAGWN